MSSGFKFRIPNVETCCGCVNDLKTAAVIIAVLGIVTCPLVSWAVIRHAYVIRVSCMVTTSSSHGDVVDVNLYNVLSFGFGANAGLGTSCMVKNKTKSSTPETFLRLRTKEEESTSIFIDFVRSLGWVVLTTDLIFLCFSINFLVKLFKNQGPEAAKYFIISGLTTVVLSFIYGLMYVSACVCNGGSFPVFEFLFACFDLITLTVWLHFFAVVHTYAKPPKVVKKVAPRRTYNRNRRNKLFMNVWSYFLIVVRSYRQGPTGS